MINYLTEITGNDKAIVFASLIGSINGAMVGQLSQHLRQQETLAAEGGIDGFNNMKAAESEDTEPPVGTPEHVEPLDIASDLKAVKYWLLKQVEGVTFMDKPITGDIGDTLDFMIKREPTVSEVALKQLADVLEMPVADVKAAHLQQMQDDKQKLVLARDRIVELEADLQYDEGEHGFSNLPPRFKARICSKAEAAIQKRVQRVVQRALRDGDLSAAGELVELRDVQSRIKNWVHREAQQDPEFNEALSA